MRVKGNGFRREKEEEEELKFLGVGEGSTSRRRAIGRRLSLPPTEGRAEVRRSKVKVKVGRSKSVVQSQMIKTDS